MIRALRLLILMILSLAVAASTACSHTSHAAAPAAAGHAAAAPAMPPEATGPVRPAPEFWFNRYCAHWGEIDDSFPDYVARVRPQAVQVGYFGPEYYSALGYMEDKNLDKLWASIGGGPRDREWLRGLIAKVHAGDAKVLGHFSLTLMYGDEARGEGWFSYFDKRWDEKLLGPKPTDEHGAPIAAASMVQRTERGTYSRKDYAVEGGSEYRNCPSNPHYREVLKRFVKAGIDLGLDGFTIVFPGREDCVCDYCQTGFRKFLAARYTPAELKEKFGIEDLATHRFASINGWYEPEAADAIHLEGLRFTQLVLWDTEREVFLDYGRSLKPDLLVGQWNHNYRSAMSGPGQIPGTFAQLNADERCTLPTPLWAIGENFVWYSIGAWFLYWKPEAGDYAQFSLVHKWLREAGRGLPQAVKRDDGVNIEVYIAESAAHGGFAYARGPDYRKPEVAAAVETYFDFLRANEDLYRGIESPAEVALVFPRSAIHDGDKSAILDFKNLGDLLTRRHVSFDVVIDELLTPARRKRYRTLLTPRRGEITPADDPSLRGVLNESVIDAPDSVVSVVWQQPARRRMMLHLVDYLAKPPASVPGHAATTAPEAISRNLEQLRLTSPLGAQVRRVRLLAPGRPSLELKYRQDARTLLAELPAPTGDIYRVVVAEW